MSNGAIHFSGKILLFFTFYERKMINLAPSATLLNASQLAQQYTTALACPITNAANSGTTLLTASGNSTQSPISLSSLQQHHHTTTTSPYIFLSNSATSDEVCANLSSTVPDVMSGIMPGKTATLSSPSTLYFYNNNSTPAIYPADFLRLWYRNLSCMHDFILF